MAEPAILHHATDPPRQHLWQERNAAITTEYALIAALIAIMAIASVLAFGDSVATLWSTMGGNVGNALAGS